MDAPIQAMTSAPSDSRLCQGCNQAISVSSQYIRVGNVNFHAEHFVCAVCVTPLHGKKFYSKKGRFYCQRDYVQLFFHACRQCEQKITNGRVIRAFGGLYHPEHFRCATCDVRLDGKYYSRDLKPYCAQHAHPPNANAAPPVEEHSSTALPGSSSAPTSSSSTSPVSRRHAPSPSEPSSALVTSNASMALTLSSSSSSSSAAAAAASVSASASSSKKCARCHEDVRYEESVRASGKVYHSRCLSCQHCQRPLAKSGSMIFRKDERLYCQQDYQELFSHRCTSCGDPILVDCISVNAEFYHAKCFRCAQCSKQLDKYLSIGGELRCSDHISASSMTVSCSVCDNSVPVHTVVAAVGCKFHPECFRCSFCQRRLEKVSVKLRDKLICCPDCLVASSVSPNLPIKEGSIARMLATRLQQAVRNYTLDAPLAEKEKNKSLVRSRRSSGRGRRLSFAGVEALAAKNNDERGENEKTAPDASEPDEDVDDDFVGDAMPTSRPRSRSGLGSAALSQRRRVSPRPASTSQRWSHRKTNTWSSNNAPSEKDLRWKKGELIGKGSFGKVYMGMLITGELIAVKQVFLKNNEDKEIARQLESEIRLMEKLTHPNIVGLLGTERHGDKFNILMEYVPGKSIDVLLESFGRFQEETIRMYTGQLVSALEYMHRNDIIHRDIKGKNILVDTNGNLKLADFGSAKQFDNILSKEAPSISYNYTPLWTAPEVLLGNYGRKVDIWSLGCVIIEMATAKSPWSECNFDNPFRALYHIGNSNSIPRIPEELSPIAQDFIRLCLIRSADERPDAKDLMKHEFLRGYIRDEDGGGGGGGFHTDDDSYYSDEDAAASDQSTSSEELKNHD